MNASTDNFDSDGLYTVQFLSFVLTTVATIEPEPMKPDESSDDDVEVMLAGDKPACRDREAALHPPQGESSCQNEDTSGAHSR